MGAPSSDKTLLFSSLNESGNQQEQAKLEYRRFISRKANEVTGTHAVQTTTQ
jgi:hypothetical protein